VEALGFRNCVTTGSRTLRWNERRDIHPVQPAQRRHDVRRGRQPTLKVEQNPSRRAATEGCDTVSWAQRNSRPFCLRPRGKLPKNFSRHVPRPLARNTPTSAKAALVGNPVRGPVAQDNKEQKMSERNQPIQAEPASTPTSANTELVGNPGLGLGTLEMVGPPAIITAL